MNVGITTSVIQRGRTGIAQYLFALTDTLAGGYPEHQFTLFVLEEDRHFFENRGYANVKIVAVSEKFRPAIKNIRWHQAVLPGLAKQERLDLLHIPSYRRMVWQAPCPRVATIHDLAPFRVSNKYDLARMFYGRVVVKYLARRQDQIICVSKNTARDVAQFFRIGKEKLNVVHNGIDHERFFPLKNEDDRAALKDRFGLKKPFFLYIARLEHPGKNHVRLIDAFDQFKKQSKSDWQLVFGGSDWHGAEEIHARISHSPFAEDIKALGFVEDKNLAALYKSADVFVYPSLYEGFGLPPLEAMACGTPVICSPRGSLREVIGDAARVIDPEDPEDIQAALLNLSSDPNLRSSFRERGFVRARLFTWENAAAQTLSVYQKALSRSSFPAVFSSSINPGSTSSVTQHP